MHLRKEVTIESDNKPLEATVKKALASAPPRLQRILLRMQKYDYTLEYKPGKELVLPDMISRAPLPETAYGSMGEKIALHVHLLTSTQSSAPASISIQVYWNVRDELSEVEGFILKNDRILVPSSMRNEMIRRIH